MPDDLGKLIDADSKLFLELTWEDFVKIKRGRSNFTALKKLRHPAKRLVKHYRDHGVPVVLHTDKWTPQRINEALLRGPHKSVYEFEDFLREEFADMIPKGYWTVLPYSLVKDKFPHLRLSPPGCVPQRDRRPRWICDYSFYGVNQETAPIVPTESMQFGRALERILRHILLSNPDHGPVYLIKLDISDGFYRIWLNARDIPKLGVVFPYRDGEEPLVAFPLVLPMGWKNSPPSFSAVTETIADVANRRVTKLVRSEKPVNIPPHQFDDQAEEIELPLPPQPIVPVIARDPHLPYPKELLAYIDVFVDDFLGLAQGNAEQRRKVRRILFHALDEVLRPLDSGDHPSRREPLSIKKLLKGDCTWEQTKIMLGWFINTIDMTIQLPEHRIARLQELLDSVPLHHRRISTKKWHQLLGELRSMSLALPGSRGLFSRLQHGLTTATSKRLNLNKGIHDDLQDFRYLLHTIRDRPTRIAEVVPLSPSVFGPHDASGQGAGGVVFPDGTLASRHNHGSPFTPIVWRWKFPPSITSQLVTATNPHGKISISDLELAGNLLQKDATVHNYDVRERTILQATDNSATMFWTRKGSTTTTKAPSALLRASAFHQRFHRYVPREDHLPGVKNLLGDDASRLFHLSDADFLAYFNSTYPQNQPWQLWTPTPQIISVVTSALLNGKFNRELLQSELRPTTTCGMSGPVIVNHWASTPFSAVSKTKSPSSKSLPIASDLETWRRVGNKFATVPLNHTYGQLDKRLPHWGPRIRGTRGQGK